MNTSPVDAAAFAELQESAGADFVRELIDTFLEEAPRMLEELRSAAAAAHADVYRRAAHSLKSNALTFGATKLGALARDLELQGLPAGGGELDAVAAEFARVAARLAELRDG